MGPAASIISLANSLRVAAIILAVMKSTNTSSAN
jgi:hypothetical protein